MASKKELRGELERARDSVEALQLEVEAHRSRDRARMRQEHDAQQQKLREQEHRERRQRLDHLGEGLLPLNGQTRWAIVNEEGETGLEVFVPLDQEEQRIVLGFLNGQKPSNAVPVPPSPTIADVLRFAPAVCPRRVGKSAALLDGILFV